MEEGLRQAYFAEATKARDAAGTFLNCSVEHLKILS